VVRLGFGRAAQSFRSAIATAGVLRAKCLLDWEGADQRLSADMFASGHTAGHGVLESGWICLLSTWFT
jgi:hypothetical protein